MTDSDRGTPANESRTPEAPPAFGSTGIRSFVIRALVATLFLGVGATLAFRYSRTTEAPPPADEHAHGAAPAPSSQEPIHLDERAGRRIGVTYAPVTFDRLSGEIRTVAQVTYDERRVKAIAPKIDGWVEQLHVNYTGQPIAMGEPLLTIYSPMLVAAQQELLVAMRLGESMAQADADTRRGAYELRDAARRRLQHWDISDDQIGELERTGVITKTLTLRAPVEGVVVEKRVLAGQRIMAGEALYQVADLRVVWLEGQVFERDLGSVRLGQRVEAEFDAFPALRREGRVTYVYPSLDPDTRALRVRVELANRDLQLKPGMYGTIRIKWVQGAPTLVVPRSAVLATGERSLVFVRRDDGMLEPRDVEVGLSTDDYTQVLRGLAQGDTVVRSATFLVDAESNLSSALGGMGAMPGMDMTPPAGAVTTSPKQGTLPRPKVGAASPRQD